MATFGAPTSTPGGEQSFSAGYVWSNRYTSPEGGTASSISVYFGTNAGASNAKCAIYSSDGSSKLKESEEKSVTAGAKRVTFNLSSSLSITGSTDYLLCVVTQGNYKIGTTSDSISSYYTDTTYTFPTSMSLTSYANHAAIYVTYTPAASGPANLKTINGLAKASVKTVNGLAIASIKTFNGLS